MFGSSRYASDVRYVQSPDDHPFVIFALLLIVVTVGAAVVAAIVLVAAVGADVPDAEVVDVPGELVVVV